MVFGGRKFNKWREQNKRLLQEIYIESLGDASLMEEYINMNTQGECRKQVREFMIKLYELGYFSKGFKEIKKDKENKDRRDLMHKAHYMQEQQRKYVH
jgi:hypothetical protein